MAAQIDGSLAFTYRLALEALRNGVPNGEAVRLLGCNQPHADWPPQASVVGQQVYWPKLLLDDLYSVFHGWPVGHIEWHVDSWSGFCFNQRNRFGLLIFRSSRHRDGCPGVSERLGQDAAQPMRTASDQIHMMVRLARTIELVMLAAFALALAANNLIDPCVSF